ncbi:uncharacterized protein CANTADRAFT_20648 [Suhomyces tanzawaensis NRRL Y-17324]|uniref:Purine-cytosine permease n=1 Tax=Suhomyces tanzawaensis NRRL Y-17324 TaxID=984487 RepID=A0A1E4SNP1_9ASCO|nr:uncharacterized protein CANTADRAFT_20648 [Suhomyces tanzawaensis NRRL Y-17324]ODV81108.1 hypothetical protein CANTADRAFT_20648 [Suhomyces tanzawaensis NRRL Y-17324]
MSKELKLSVDGHSTSATESYTEIKYTENKYFAWVYQLDEFGIETRGIERLTAEERRCTQQTLVWQFVNVIGLWFAACGGLTSMSSFFLATLVFGLNSKNALVSGIIGMLIGCLVPAYCSTMGPESGCRQIVSARLLFGQWGVKIVSFICIVGGVGWSVVNCVLGGEVLAGLGPNVPILAGIIIISVLSMVISIFGIRVLLRFQTVTAIPVTIASILFYIVVCKKIGYLKETDAMIAATNNSAITSTGNWLSFFTIGYSVTATWGSGASDYYILFPQETPPIQVFLVTFLGISVPTTFVAVVATLCGSIAYGYPPWNEAYQQFGVGGIINEAFKPWGNFGKFVVFVLYLSLVCNNIMNTYSCAFEFQLMDHRLVRVPRWCWVILVTVVYFVLSMVGKEHFSTIISNFLPMLAYWISIYITVLLEENLIFRTSERMRRLHHQENIPSGLHYNWSNWNKPQHFTMGLATVAAFCIGAVGPVLGMNQVYWRGPIAAKLGENGGDVGFWLCAAFTAVAYPPLRYLELKKFGR